MLIDGQNVHFLHVRSPEPDAMPLVICHGYLGSVVEFMSIIGPLTVAAGVSGPMGRQGVSRRGMMRERTKEKERAWRTSNTTRSAWKRKMAPQR